MDKNGNVFEFMNQIKYLNFWIMFSVSKIQPFIIHICITNSTTVIFVEMSMDDLEAIQLLKRGEIRGLETLVVRYQVKAIRAAFLITQDKLMAEDIVQDVFVNIFRHIRHFNAERSFEPYFMRSVVNAALNVIQKETKQINFLEDWDFNPLEELITAAATVEDRIEFDQRRKSIIDAIAKLPPRQRAVTVQKYYLAMSEKEMSETLNIPPGTIKWLLNAARARLRILLNLERSIE